MKVGLDIRVCPLFSITFYLLTLNPVLVVVKHLAFIAHSDDFEMAVHHEIDNVNSQGHWRYSVAHIDVQLRSWTESGAH